MAIRLCYPTDIPRGALLVSEDLIVADVAVWQHDEGPIVAVCNAGMRTVLLEPAEQVEIDEDTPERRARLDFARSLVGS